MLALLISIPEAAIFMGSWMFYRIPGPDLKKFVKLLKTAIFVLLITSSQMSFRKFCEIFQNSYFPKTLFNMFPILFRSGVASFMSFKGFVMQQDDDIDENEAVRRYQEYKVEYKRTQINDFFVLHKAEEW